MKDNKKYLLIGGALLVLVFYVFIIGYNIYSNYSENIALNDEIKSLNDLVKKEKKYNSKIEKLGEDFNSKMFFEKEEYFEAYIRKTLYKYTKEYIKYESKDVDDNLMKISVIFKIKSDKIYHFIDELEYGNKFVVIEKLTMKRVDTPNLEVSLSLKGFYL